MWNLFSFLVGFALGWNHFRMYHKAMLAMLEQPTSASHKRLAILSGVFRHFLTFTAGILLIWVAKVEPFHVCGGLFAATVSYRLHLLYRRDQSEGIKDK